MNSLVREYKRSERTADAEKMRRATRWRARLGGLPMHTWLIAVTTELAASRNARSARFAGIFMRWRVRSAARVLAGLALASACALPWSNSHAQALPPAVDFHVVSSGGSASHNSCYRLSGAVGQVAPGYSSSSMYSIFAGFWAAAPTTGLDEIFFNVFEGC